MHPTRQPQFLILGLLSVSACITTYQIPMPPVPSAVVLRRTYVARVTSPRNSHMLLAKARSGASGMQAENITTNPNCSTMSMYCEIRCMSSVGSHNSFSNTCRTVSSGSNDKRPLRTASRRVWTLDDFVLFLGTRMFCITVKSV